MAVLAAIKFTQGVNTAPAGIALLGDVGTPVVATNGDNSNVAQWEWEMVTVPTGSLVPTGLLSAGVSAAFTPDVSGSYLLKLIVKDVNGALAFDIRTFGILEDTGRLIVPFSATASPLNFGGQTQGWAKYQEEYNRQVDELVGVLADGVAVASEPSLNFLHALVTDDPGGLKLDITPRIQVYGAGVLAGTRPAINFVGATVTDDVGNNRANVVILGSDPIAKAVITTNVALTGAVSSWQTDLVAVANGEVVLVAGNTNKVENGLYAVNTAGAWARVSFTTGATVSGAIVYVGQGARNGGTRWQCTSVSGADVVGTNNLTWYQYGNVDYQNLFDIDCAAGGLQTLSSDIAYTHRGVSLLKFNTAGEAAATTIGDANGLRFRPAGGKNYTNATRSIVGVTFNPFAFPHINTSRISPAASLRFFMRPLSYTNCVAADDGLVFGIEFVSGGVNYHVNLCRAVGNVGVSEGTFTRFIGGNTDRWNSAVRALPFATHGILCFEIPFAYLVQAMIHIWTTALWVSDWPSMASSAGGGGQQVYVNTVQAGNFDGFANNWRMVLGASRGGASAVDIKIGNLRGDLKFNA